MRFQLHKGSCGSAALGNALLAIGIKRSEEELSKLCKQTAANGTNAVNLRRAAETIAAPSAESNLPPMGLIIDELKESRDSAARLVTRDCLMRGRVLVALCDEWEHYVAVVGLLGERVCVVDSATNDLWHSLTWDEFSERWAKDEVKQPYWALILGRSE